MSSILDTVDIGTQVISPEQRLFVGVILNAAMEASGTLRARDRETKARQASAAAFAWFNDGGEDFQTVCTLAGLEPSNVRAGVLDYLERTKAAPNAPMIRRAGYRTAASERVTMRDVAEHAGVSTMTVARVMDGNPLVSASTRQRVQTSVLELGYSRRGGRSVH